MATAIWLSFQDSLVAVKLYLRVRRQMVRDWSNVSRKSADSSGLDNMEVRGVQLGLENICQGDGVVAVDGDDRIPETIILRCG